MLGVGTFSEYGENGGPLPPPPPPPPLHTLSHFSTVNDLPNADFQSEEEASEHTILKYMNTGYIF